MDDGFTRPDHTRHGLGDRTPVLDDVIQAGFTAVVLADCIGTDKTSALARLQVIVSTSEPIDAIIRSAVHLRKTFAKAVDVGSIHLVLQLVFALIGWVTDDRVRGWAKDAPSSLILNLIPVAAFRRFSRAQSPTAKDRPKRSGLSTSLLSTSLKG
jgi:hypothetical protein